MKLSVVIPCRNAAQTIEAQLEALITQQWTGPWEIVVSDNGSTDGSLAIVERYRERLPNLRVVDSSDKRGEPHARNVGVRAATGDAVVFCDADDEVAPGWLMAMGKALSKYDFVACRMDTEKLNAPWIHQSRGSPQRDGLQTIWYPPYLPHAGGGTLGFKRSIHEAVGGFDESLLCLCDTDYCFKVQLTGVKLHFVPDAVIHIRFREAHSDIFRQARLWAEYNTLLLSRYRPAGMKTSWVWKRHVRDWIDLAKALPVIRRKEGRAEWMWWFGWHVGWLRGSIKHRIPLV